MHVRKLVASTAWTMAVVGLASCGGPAPASSNPQEFVASIGLTEPQHLVPSDIGESAGHQVVSALYTPLVDFDEDFRPVMDAAESITTTDNKMWTIRIRDGWTFHNGEKVTADAYINAWNAGAYGPNAQRLNFFYEKIAGYDDLNPKDGKVPTAKKLSGLVKKDDLTFEVTLKEPYFNFITMLYHAAFFPAPMAAFEDVANNRISPSYEQAPIGQGPFKMKGVWQHDQIIETERYQDYKGNRTPKVGGIAFKLYQSLPTQYQDLLADQLDVVPLIPLESMASVRADLGSRFEQSLLSTIQVIGFPTYDKHYSKVAVRKAISMAIDRDEIIKTIFLDNQRALRSFVSPVVPGYRENTCGDACTFNPVKAKALFDSAGGAAAVGGKIVITYNFDGGHKPWVDATCNQIKRNLGVECVGNPEPKFAELLTKVQKKESVGAFRTGWVFDYPAIENYLWPMYSTTGSSNFYGYSNPQLDRLLAEGDRAATLEDATKLYQQAEDLLGRDLPVIPLRYGINNFGHSRRVRNVRMDAFQRVQLFDIEANSPPQ